MGGDGWHLLLLCGGNLCLCLGGKGGTSLGSSLVLGLPCFDVGDISGQQSGARFVLI